MGRRARRAVVAGAVVVVAALVGYGVWERAHPTVLTTSTVVDASPAEVWDVLADNGSWDEWNPFIVSSSGDLVPGARLQNVHSGDDGTSTYTPEVLVADGRELRWLGRVGPGGLFDGEHSFVLVEQPDGRTRVVQTEVFRGLLVPPARSWLRGDVEPRFAALDAALAAEVERRSG